MPAAMAMAGPIAGAIGVGTTFLVVGVTLVLFAVVAIVWARPPEDEMANPLD